MVHNLLWWKDVLCVAAKDTEKSFSVTSLWWCWLHCEILAHFICSFNYSLTKKKHRSEFKKKNLSFFWASFFSSFFFFFKVEVSNKNKSNFFFIFQISDLSSLCTRIISECCTHLIRHFNDFWEDLWFMTIFTNWFTNVDRQSVDCIIILLDQTYPEVKATLEQKAKEEES